MSYAHLILTFQDESAKRVQEYNDSTFLSKMMMINDNVNLMQKEIQKFQDDVREEVRDVFSPTDQRDPQFDTS